METVSDATLDKPVSDDDVEEIVGLVHRWEDIRNPLGLNPAIEEEIKNDLSTDYRGQKRKCIEKWKQMKGNKATYRAFIGAAEVAQEQGLADNMRALLNRQNTAGKYMH